MSGRFHEELWRGRLVTWLHKPRGGYGYVLPIPARVLKAGRARTSIAAKLANGGERTVSVPTDAIAIGCVICSRRITVNGGHAPRCEAT